MLVLAGLRYKAYNFIQSWRNSSRTSCYALSLSSVSPQKFASHFLRFSSSPSYSFFSPSFSDSLRLRFALAISIVRARAFSFFSFSPVSFGCESKRRRLCSLVWTIALGNCSALLCARKGAKEEQREGERDVRRGEPTVAHDDDDDAQERALWRLCGGSEMANPTGLSTAGSRGASRYSRDIVPTTTTPLPLVLLLYTVVLSLLLLLPTFHVSLLSPTTDL